MQHQILLHPGADLAGFKAATRKLIAAEAPPQAVIWTEDIAPSLFGDAIQTDKEPAQEAPAFNIPRPLGELATTIVCHRDAERYALLYEAIWRVTHGEKALLENASDPLVHRLETMAKAIKRDLHKMHAFLRFRSLRDDAGTERLIAWFEPCHYILQASADFFVERFKNVQWAILTPIGSLSWNGEALVFGPPARIEDAPAEDAFESAWQSYYESIFNPARLNLKAMAAEMPKKYWRNLPETSAIPALIRSAETRVNTMIAEKQTASKPSAPPKALQAMDKTPRSLAELNALILAAEPMVEGGTRAVLGEGPAQASLVFVGEQPGDQEDLQGRPFVGPAGQILNRAMAEAGLDRDDVYVTNAVKHFKYEQRGKRRLHQSPTAGEISHYRWWLKWELDLIQPKLVVALGASAALALNGKALSVTRSRGPIEFGEWHGFVTVHPSYLLRIPDEAAKAQAYDAFRADLATIKDISCNSSGATLAVSST
jgi:DNA polymerase